MRTIFDTKYIIYNLYIKMLTVFFYEFQILFVDFIRVIYIKYIVYNEYRREILHENTVFAVIMIQCCIFILIFISFEM